MARVRPPGLPGDAYCWGQGIQGQLGIGAPAAVVLPSLVRGGLTFTKIVTGLSTSCALSASGATYCWGRNDFGQLGGCDETSWGEDRLSAGETIAPGAQRSWQVDAGCYDIRARATTGASVEWFDRDLPAGQARTFTASSGS